MIIVENKRIQKFKKKFHLLHKGTTPPHEGGGLFLSQPQKEHFRITPARTALNSCNNTMNMLDSKEGQTSPGC
jgi:hypothetical protein